MEIIINILLYVVDTYYYYANRKINKLQSKELESKYYLIIIRA